MSGKIEIDVALLKRLSEIAASALNDTISHKVVKEETLATDSEIGAAALVFFNLSDGVATNVPQSEKEFSELTLALENRDFDNRFLKQG